jgi:hypothetical protein
MAKNWRELIGKNIQPPSTLNEAIDRNARQTPPFRAGKDSADGK